MGDNYEELVELGFEGIDKFANRYHDKVYDHAPALPRPWRGKQSKDKKQDRERPRDVRRPRRHSDERDERDGRDGRNGRNGRNGRDRSTAGVSDDERSMYAPERRRDVEERESVSGRDADRGYYVAEDSLVVARERDGSGYRGGYDVAPYRAPPPAYAYGQTVAVADGAYGDRWATDRGRPEPYRRPSSYSPPRSQRSHASPPRRLRSKSPNHHRMAATVVGALAGGVLGHNAKHDSKLATVGGAIVGGLIAREGEKWYDQREDRKAEDEERRARRRRERERYD